MNSQIEKESMSLNDKGNKTNGRQTKQHKRKCIKVPAKRAIDSSVYFKNDSSRSINENDPTVKMTIENDEARHW